jgi:hypothetical protein
MSYPRDRKAFLAFWNAKGLLPETRKRSMGGGKNFLLSTARLSFVGNGIFWWKAKTKMHFSQCRSICPMRYPLSHASPELLQSDE